MAPERRLEYERSSASTDSSDDGVRTDRRASANDSEESASFIGVARSEVVQFVDRDVQYVKIGSLTGVAAFAIVYLAAYQLTLAARGGISPAEGESGTWVNAGIVTLVSHGGTLVQEPESMAYLTIQSLQIGPLFLVPVTIFVLVAAGAVVGRYLESEPIAVTAIAVGSAGWVYVGALMLLTRFARYSPEATDSNVRPGTDVDTMAIGLDPSFLLTSLVFVFAFIAFGAGLVRSEDLLSILSQGDPDSSDGEPTKGADIVESESQPMSADGDPSAVASGGSNDEKPNGGQSNSNRSEPTETRTETSGKAPSSAGHERDHDRYRPDESSVERSGHGDRNHDRYRPTDN